MSADKDEVEDDEPPLSWGQFQEMLDENYALRKKALDEFIEFTENTHKAIERMTQENLEHVLQTSKARIKEEVAMRFEPYRKKFNRIVRMRESHLAKLGPPHGRGEPEHVKIDRAQKPRASNKERSMSKPKRGFLSERTL